MRIGWLDAPQARLPSAVAGGGGGGAGWLANLPGSYTTVVTDYAFNHSLAALDDAPVGDGSGWNVLFNTGGNMYQSTDATAPHSPSNIVEWHIPTGHTAGTGVGDMYMDISTSINALYITFYIWHDANYEWNSISNKMFYWEDGNLIIQSRHDASYLSFYNGTEGGGTSYECNIHSPTGADFEGRWALVEAQIIRGASGTVKIWLDGVLCMNRTINIPLVSSVNELKIDSTWGGLTSAASRDSYRRMDHIYISRP